MMSRNGERDNSKDGSTSKFYENSFLCFSKQLRLPVTFVRTLNGPSKMATKSTLVELRLEHLYVKLSRYTLLTINRLAIEHLTKNEGKSTSRKIQLQVFMNRERGSISITSKVID